MLSKNLCRKDFGYVGLISTLLLCLCSTLTCNADESVPGDVVKGKFGNALAFSRSNRYWGQAKPVDEYTKCPLTVECWAKASSKDNNIFLSADNKLSSDHWEIYSCAGTGVFSAFLPGWDPSVIYSTKDITDGQWHYLAMVLDGTAVRLFVDGKKTADVKATRRPRVNLRNGPLMLGQTFTNEQVHIGCDGIIDEIRLSNAVRNVSRIPQSPFKPDGSTTGLWHLDDGPKIYSDSSENDNPFMIMRPERGNWTCLDEKDKAGFKAGPSPLDSKAETVELTNKAIIHPKGPEVISLDGEWQMAQGGFEARRLVRQWTDAIPATVPGSVHTALVKQGIIPDPRVGLNDVQARDKSFKTWWFKRKFPRPKGMRKARLVFGGIAVKADVWLNGKLLGTHEGMFGGPEFDIGDLLQDKNTLIVKIYPAPFVLSQGQPNPFFTCKNVGWLYTVVFNNVYGWHYSNIPAIGIWRSVSIEGSAVVKISHPFVATRDAQQGIVELATSLEAESPNWSGKLTGTIAADNFSAGPLSFSYNVASASKSKKVHLRFHIPEPKLWWPNDLGEHNLYRLKLSFIPDTGGISDYKETIFGIRTVKMAPVAGKPSPKLYNWTFVINKRPVFVKGTNWCTMDPLMDFSRERYDRFISLAADQHVQIFRAWGSGMPETDDFYDLCDRKGIMVIQEWPTAWNSHRQGWQPYNLLEETIRRNTLRLRNHPSLVMWGAGNESDDPYGKAIDMMGRYSTELDGTRPFHRGEPWGGSLHNYDVYWGRKPLAYNLKWKNLCAPISVPGVFIGEFGVASMPVYESVQRYLPDDEKNLWPAPDDKTFAHHTPVFNTMEDFSRLKQYAYYFVPKDCSMEEFTVGSQMAQATGVRHTLELARTLWPNVTGSVYYKMNDNYPAASWSCADWYGAPKIGHYIFMDSFAPLHGCVIFPALNFQGQEFSAPVYLLDDADALSSSKWQVIVCAYDSKLSQIERRTFEGSGSIGRVSKLGTFSLTSHQSKSTPLFIVAEVVKDGTLADRTFYWTNYEAQKGCLFKLPAARVTMTTVGSKVMVHNVGKVPAVGVHIVRPGHADTFKASDNYFWLDPGESKTILVNQTEGLDLKTWNKM